MGMDGREVVHAFFSIPKPMSMVFRSKRIANPAGRLAGIYLALRQKIYEGVPWTYDTPSRISLGIFKLFAKGCCNVG